MCDYIYEVLGYLKISSLLDTFMLNLSIQLGIKVSKRLQFNVINIFIDSITPTPEIALWRFFVPT